MLKRLLVPLDGTRMAEAVLPLAVSLAERAGARMTLLHMVERVAPAAVHGEMHLTSAEEAQRYLQAVAQSFPSPTVVDLHVHRREIDDVAHSLADHADELEPDLIVMTAHGQKRFGQWFAGTVPQRVIQQTPTPVLLVHQRRDRRAVASIHRVVVPLDRKPEHEAAIPLAVEIAQLFSASVRLATAVPTRGTLLGTDAAIGQFLPAATRESLDLAEKASVDYLAQHVARLRAAAIDAAATVARGAPLDVLRQTILDYQADLVALATHGAAGTRAFWAGSMCQKLIGRVSASFLLVPATEFPRGK